MATNKKLISAAIDFGTTYSGYAFSFTSDKKAVHTFLWEWDGFCSEKTPTNILFDKKKNFVSFGFQAERDFIKMEQLGISETAYFFKLFKLKLFNNKNLNRTTMLTDYSMKKQMLAVDVFSAGIKFLKDHLWRNLDGRGQLFRHDDIQWVLTVPAIWDDAAKQFMRESANKAGISDDQLVLALEPEAASIHCLLNKDEIAGLKYNLGAGQRYMVVDNGGGTVDVTVHEVKEDCTVKEIYKASGGDWGGMRVDDAFQELLLEIFDIECLEKLSIEDKLKLVSEFQKTKQTNGKDNPDPLTIWLPQELKVRFDINELVGTEYEGKIWCTANRLRISKDLYKSFFDGTVCKIIEHVADIFRVMRSSSNDIPLIIMVGGFSSSLFLQAEMKRCFPFKSIVVPNDPSVSVLKGAVQIGHTTSVISGRIMPYTYGVDVSRAFISGSHDPKHMFLYNSERFCGDLFDKYVTIGQDVKYGDASQRKSYEPLRPDQTAISFSVYRSTKEKPTYVDESSCTRIGTVDMPLSYLYQGDQSISAQMEFGQIELKLAVVDENTDEKRLGKFDFL